VARNIVAQEGLGSDLNHVRDSVFVFGYEDQKIIGAESGNVMWDRRNLGIYSMLGLQF
jgi:hypothetical protein